MRTLGYKLTLCLAVIFLPFNAFALGLGEIEVSSFLNQPLRAEIEVISTRAGEVDDLLVSLASREAFRRSGLSRPSHLSELRFSVRKNEEGSKATVVITTKNAVKEPFLNFLVEADWTKGRVLREFTILLDPPFFAQSAPSASQPTPIAEQTPQPAPIASQPVAQESTQTTQAAQPSEDSIPFVADSEFVESNSAATTTTDTTPVTSVDNEIVVEKGDYLWAIAEKLKTGENSMAQIMLAIQAVNPDSFYNDNINNLKAGTILRMPVEGEITSFSKQEAYAEVLRQNGLWDDYVARVTGDASVSQETTVTTAESSAVEADVQQQGNLKLLTPDDDQSTDTASVQTETSDVDSNQLRKQLALAEEEMEAAIIENSELKSRITEMESQLEKITELERIIKIQDDSIANLQANAAEKGTEVTPGAEMEQVEVQEMVNEPETEIQEEETVSMSETMAAPEIVEGEVEAEQQDAIVESNEITPMVEAEPEVLPETEIEDTVEEAVETIVEQPEEEITPVAPPIIVTEEIGEDSLLPSFDNLLKDPTVLAGLGALGALILGFILLRRVKSRKEDEEILEGMDLNEDETDHLDLEITPVKEEVIAELEEQVKTEEQEIDFSETAIITSTEIPLEDPDEPKQAEEPEEDGDQDDVLNEVDVYLAYGLYENAEELLKENIKKEPSRADYHVKLLDTYFATKDADSFVTEATEFKQSGIDVDKYWDRIQTMGYSLAPENDLFSGAEGSSVSSVDLEYAKPESADFDLGSEAEDDILDIGGTDIGLNSITPDEDEFSFDMDEDISKATADLESENASLDFDLPDDLDLGAGNEEVEDSDAADEDSLDFNIDEDDSFLTSEIQMPEISADDEVEVDAEPATQDSTASIEQLLSITSEEEDADEDDDMPDIDMTNFDVDISEIDLDEDLLSDTGEESDISKVAARTGTFSPGDFERSQEIPIDLNPEPESETESEVVADTEVIPELSGNTASDSSEASISAENTVNMDDISSLMLPDDVDEVSTKLDLAKAFIDMGDTEGAKSSLNEVLEEGTDTQKAEAEALLKQT